MEKNQMVKAKCVSYQLDLFSDVTILSKLNSELCTMNQEERLGTIVQMSSYKTKQQVESFYEQAKRLTAHLD